MPLVCDAKECKINWWLFDCNSQKKIELYSLSYHRIRLASWFRDGWRYKWSHADISFLSYSVLVAMPLTSYLKNVKEVDDCLIAIFKKNRDIYDIILHNSACKLI